MNYLDFAYELNQLEKRLDDSTYTYVIRDLIESDKTNEELVRGFIDVILNISPNIEYKLEEAYDEGYEDAKREYECDCGY